MAEKTNTTLVLMWVGVAVIASGIFAMVSSLYSGSSNRNTANEIIWGNGNEISDTAPKNNQVIYSTVNQQKSTELVKMLGLNTEGTEREAILMLLESKDFQRARLSQRKEKLLSLLRQLGISANTEEVEKFLREYAEFSELIRTGSYFYSLPTLEDDGKISRPLMSGEDLLETLGFGGSQSNKKTEEVDSGKTPEQLALEAELKDVTNFAIDELDRDICEELENEDAQKECISAVTRSQALNSQSAVNCAILENAIAIKNCQDEVYFSRALTDGDISICRHIWSQETQERCEEALAGS